MSNNTLRDEKIGEDLYRKYIGGVGLQAYYLYKETDDKTDPLGPENRLMFMVGPYTGTGIPSSGRHSIVAKSPLTGIWGEADVGGHWGLGLKGTGYDGIIVQGASDKPVYIYIDEDGAHIEDAGDIWGKDTYETDALLKQKYGNNIVVQSIGQAGERQIKIACIMTDGKDARAGGRCGLGAVMGSKKLKAVVVKGRRKPEIHNPEALRKEVVELAKYQRENRGGMHEHGTAEGLIGNELSGDLPIKNWKQGAWDRKSEKLTGEVITEKYLTEVFHCGNCVIGCGRTIKIEEGRYAGVEGSGPEYETIACLGSNLLVEDLEAICKANELCNRYGLDTISTGGVIGFAMECFEHDLIKEEDTGGLKLDWGSPEVLIEMIKMIVNKKGIGELLGNGVREAANVIGGLAKEFAIETKGLEFPAHEPRVFNGTALSYATSNRGACHLADLGSRFYEKALAMPEIGLMEPAGTLTVEGKGKMIAGLQDVSGLYDSLKICKFTVWFGVDTSKLLKWLNMITGWDMTMEEFLLAGERIFNLKRIYNVRCGISRKDDTLPPRILNSIRGEGGCADHLPPLNIMLKDYYEARNWDEFGIPKPDTLDRLEISNL